MVEKRGTVDRGISSKGQVTVFIIIGIVVVFAFAAILFFTKTATEGSILSEEEPTIAAVPQQFQPVQSFTELCLTQIGTDGLVLLGQQGGYIYPEVVGKYSLTQPTDADGINLEPLNIPYWYYNTKPNAQSTFTYTSLQPKLHEKDDDEMSIEAQLSRYVEEKVDECLKEYNAFDLQGFAVQKDGEDKSVDVRVTDNTVNFLLEMPIIATKGEESASMEKFFVKVPIRLKHYYETAAKIKEAQQDHRFLELQALDLLVTYGGVSADKLPPMETAVRFDFVPTAYWAKVDVEEKVKGLLVSNVPMLRYLGATNFYRHTYDADTDAVVDLSDLHQKNYDNMIIPLEDSEDLEVNFDYFGWNPYFDMNDKGGRIEPRTAGINFLNLQLNTQHYYSMYDISYPVLVTLRDPNALLGDGYTFVFALESNIRNNRVAEPDSVIPPPVVDPGESLACEENQRDTEILNTLVIGSDTGEPVEAVNIGFTIPNQDDCLMGSTDDDGEFASKYPAVFGGVGSFMKKDYLTAFYPIDTYKHQDSSAVIGYAQHPGYPQPVITLHPKKTVNVRVMKKTLEKCIEDEDGETACYTQGLFAPTGEPELSYKPEQRDDTHKWVFVNVAKPLSEAESAVLTLNRLVNSEPGVFHDEYVTTVNVDGDEIVEMDLYPGIYEVSGLVTNNEGFVIPEEERCGDECFTLDEQVLERTLSGQVQWDKDGMYLAVTPEMLYNSEQFTFYILTYNEQGVPEGARVIEDLSVMGKLINVSEDVRAELEPIAE